MKTTLQKLVVSLLVLVMFLTSNGTLVLAAEINDVVDANNDVAIENVTEALETDELNQVDTNEDEPNEGLTNEQNQLVVEEKEDVEEDVAVEETENIEENVVTESTIEAVVNTNDTIDVNESVEAIEENTTIVETKNETIFNEDTITFTGKANNVDVKVVAQPGTFPVGTTMVVTPVEKTEVINAVEAIMKDEVNDVKAVDISFYANGEEVEPNKNVNVELNTSALKAKKDLNVVHIQDSGKIEVMDLTKASKTTAEFKSESFSVYVVVDSETDARLLVEFKTSEDGNDEVDNDVIDTIYIKRKDLSHINTVLYEPSFNIASNVVFKGWTEDPNYVVKQDGSITSTSPVLDINQIRTDVIPNKFPTTDGTTIKYYAVLVRTYKINYIDIINPTNPETSTVNLGSHEVSFRADADEKQNYVVNMAYTPDSEHDFEGWLVVDGEDNIIGYEEGQAYLNETEIVVKGDVTFSVKAPKGNWLVFDENGKGGTYNAPQFILSGEKTKEPTITMVRNGYTFGGWYDTKEHADAHGLNPSDETGKYQFDQEINAKTTIYASWIPNTRAAYTVILWTQNQDRTGYEVKDSYVNTNGVVGQDIPYTSVENIDEDYATITGASNDIGHYIGFCLKDSSKDQHVTITPEGDAVLNLYYDRIEYNFKFYIYRNGTQNNRYDYANNSGNGRNLNDLVTWHENQTEHPSVTGYEIQSENVGGRTYYYFVMKAYYGEDLVKTGKWPTYDKITGANGRQAVSYVMMVGTKLKPNPTNQGSGTVKGIISVLNENILGATNDANGNYVIVRFPDNSNNWRYHIWFETIDGEDYSGKTTRTYEGKTYYEDDVLIVRSSNTDVNSQNEPKYTGFDFLTKKGQNWNNNNYWTTTEGNTTLYHLNFVYNRQQYKISYFDGNYVDGDGNTIENHGKNLLHESGLIGQGANIPDEYKNYVPTLPNGQKGYVFEGWYIDEGCTAPYTFDKMPVGGITVYAKWRLIQYRVFLHPNVDKSDNSLDWGNNQKMNFRVDYGGKVSSPTGLRDEYEFVGWYTDPGLTKPFNADAYVLNETTVTADYDKTVDMTDPSDSYGSDDATSNTDTDRFWITKKLDLYAKWRSKIPGALGINVEYEYQDSHDTTQIVQDDKKYVDKANANAINGFTPPEGKIFDKWQVQTWNGSSYEPTDTYVYAGGSFEVLKSDAKIDIISQEGDTITEATYTVRLKAIYRDVEEATPTHIKWYKNDGTVGPHYTDPIGENTLAINEGVAIKEAQTRTGYIFKGWAKILESNIPSTNNPKDLEGTQLVYYNKDDGKYYREASFTNEAKEVAADEDGVYEALIAVWEGEPDELKYMPNGGTGTMDPTEGKVGQKVTVEGNRFTREGYTFTGWNTSPDNSGTAYGAGSRYELTPQDDILYAQWSINSYNLTINYVYEDGSQAANTYTDTLDYNEAYSVTSPTITGYTADKPVVSGTMPAGDVTVTVTYKINSYDLTIHYVYENGDTAAEDYTATLDYNEQYEVDSPDITGYTASEDPVTGTMPASNKEVTVVYSINSYDLTIHYVYENGDTAAEDYTATLDYNEQYEVDSPDITGYTASEDPVTGTMPASNKEVTVIYSINSYDLTIHYVYENGDTAAEDYTATLDYNEQYEVDSPDITGYTASEDPVTGTMPASNKEVTVIYSINSYDLTIHYVYENGDTAAEDYTATLDYNEQYEVDSPDITGYTASEDPVTGTMPASNKEVTVIYSINSYDLTIHYVYENGDTAAEDYTATLDYNEQYEVDSPDIAGYTASEDPVTGTMPASNKEVTVVYSANSYEYSVEYYYENESGEYDLGNTVTDTATFNTEVLIDPEATADYNGHHYVFEKVDPESKKIIIKSDKNQNIIKVYYAIDEISDENDDPDEPDDIPDKYQVIVYYEVEHGKWDDTNNNDKRLEIVTLLDDDGNWSKEGKAELHAPAVGQTPDDGYLKSGSWDKEPVEATIADKDQDTTYTFTYDIGSYGYTVNYYYENAETGEYEQVTSKTETGEATFGTDVAIDPAKTDDYNEHHYVLTTVDPSKTITIKSNPEENVINVYYDIDEISDENDDPDEPDDIPDKYQVIVYYEVKHGKWDDTNNNDKRLEIVTLVDDEGNWSKDGSAALTAPAVGQTPDDGYLKSGSWDKEPVEATIADKDQDTTYTFTYDIGSYGYTVNYYYENAETGEYEQVTSKTETGEATFGTDVTIDPAKTDDYNEHHYVLTTVDPSKTITIKSNPDENVINVYYDIDEISDENDDPEEPDDIPDKYQVIVYYEVEHGKWDDTNNNDKRLEIVTLVDDEGNWSKDGSAALTAPAVGQTPDDGYLKSGSWDKEPVEATIADKDQDTTYTFTYDIGSYGYTVNYYYENAETGEYEQVTSKTETGEATFGTDVAIDPAKTDDYNEHHYVLTTVDPSKTITIKSNPEENVINVYYDIDEISDENDDPDEPDDIPDKYQVIVYYEVKHGKWDDTNNNDKRLEIVTLVDDEGNWSKDGSAALTAPAVGQTPDDGYLKSGSWDKEPVEATIADKDQDTTYTFTYDIGSYGYTVNYYYENAETGEYEQVTSKTETGEAIFGTDVTIDPAKTDDYNEHHYVLTTVDPSKTITIKSNPEENIINVYYDLDDLNDNPNGDDTPTGGDEIPDKYQICVYYNVVNGAWDEIEDNKETTDKDESRAQVLDVVTLKLDNEPSTDENAEGELEVPVVGGKPDKGFCEGEWDKEVPKTVKKSADKTEYTYTYLEDNLNDDPEGPDTPTGGDGIPDKYQIVINYEVENGAWDDTTTDPKVDVVTLYKDGELSDAEDAEGEIEIPEVGHEPNVGYWTGDWNTTLPETVKKTDNGNLYVYTYVICTPTQDDPPVRKVIFGDEPATSDIFKFTLSAISNTAGFDVMPMPEGSNGQSKTVEIKGAGEYEFGIIEFTMPGTYIYQIIEEDTGNSDYEYDQSVYEVIYVVSQNEDKLECARTMRRDGKQTDQDAVFMNKYTAPVSNIEVSENPRTGDSIYLYIVMLIVSTFGIVISAIEDPKRRKNYSK